MQGSDSSGFSLGEVLIALALLGALIAGISGLWPQLVGGSAEARDLVQDHLLAAARMEQCIRLGYAGLAPGAVVDNPPQAAGFTRRTIVTQELPDLYRVKVVVRGPSRADSLETFLARR